MTEIRKNMGYDRHVAPRRAEVPAWLLLAASPTAVKLYALLAQLADDETSTSDELLEQTIGDAETVETYMQELENLGAVEVGPGEHPAVTVHFEPPAGFTGPQTIAEYYEQGGAR